MKAALFNSQSKEQSEERGFLQLSPQGFLEYYECALGLLTAKACSGIAARLVKIKEPYRESMYPYRNRKNGEPQWWPPLLPYKSPHSLKKEGMFNSPLPLPLSRALTLEQHDKIVSISSFTLSVTPTSHSMKSMEVSMRTETTYHRGF